MIAFSLCWHACREPLFGLSRAYGPLIPITSWQHMPVHIFLHEYYSMNNVFPFLMFFHMALTRLTLYKRNYANVQKQWLRLLSTLQMADLWYFPLLTLLRYRFLSYRLNSKPCWLAINVSNSNDSSSVVGEVPPICGLDDQSVLRHLLQ